MNSPRFYEKRCYHLIVKNQINRCPKYENSLDGFITFRFIIPGRAHSLHKKPLK
ncbi:hypothetical protein NNO_0644 [Hydrogenimonas sp.]|nr:hypothetical protein NNO_0644 [Hydrogenimonas sp.]